jgi:NAD(P)-dependent dehydrogenase (short-subunit alcohol dehydrogenase family)
LITTQRPICFFFLGSTAYRPRPDDIAAAVIFFASRQADWMTGQVLYVGGGNRM